jgi:hypothetical protein
MRDDKIHGAALIAGALAFMATGALHPTGSQLMASPAAFAEHGPINVLAHLLGLFGIWLTAFGIVGFARRVGLARPDVTAALVAFGLAAVMVTIAAIVDGIVATRLAARYVETIDEAQREVLRGFMTFCYNLASSLSRYYVTATAIAILLWSWAAWRVGFDRALPWIGAAIAVGALWAQMRGQLKMNVHDVIVLAVGQGLWMIWTGVALWRASKER